ncbi:hypothetical protein [Paenibacillus sp. GYB003]|uniref:hypothetical protein n=1 Tax=Paenibacillus sp. GYB003 TaxID=2994392 RepID=UPI002F961252
MNFYDIQGRKREKAFFRKWGDSGRSFETGKGCKNFIEQVTDKTIYIRTRRSKQPIAISRTNLRKACGFVMYKRTTTRKQLEHFHHFSSALMGLLRMIFMDISRFTKTVRGLLRLSIRGTRWFCAGADRAPADMQLAKLYGNGFLLMSYWMLRDDTSKNWIRHLKKHQLPKILLDSGAFSAFKASNSKPGLRPLDVVEYAQFIKEHSEWIENYFNLDVVQDPVQTDSNYRYLKSVGLNPIPVWQCNAGFEALDSIINEDDHDFIGIGGTCFLTEKERLQLFDELFKRWPTYNFHALGVSDRYLFEYPWFSADGTGCWNPRKWRTIPTVRGHVPLPDNWSWEEGVAYCLELFSELETNYSGQIFYKLFLPPELKRPVQLTLL